MPSILSTHEPLDVILYIIMTLLLSTGQKIKDLFIHRKGGKSILPNEDKFKERIEINDDEESLDGVQGFINR